MTESHPVSFLGDLQEVLRGLRAALLELYQSVGADPAAPQEVSRRIGITRSQAWKLSKVLASRDPSVAARQVLGPTGFRLVLSAFETRGAPRKVLVEVRRRVAAFDAMVRRHTGDRSTFDLTLDSLQAADGDLAAVEAGRKLSFRGNSSIWGVQARMRLRLSVVQPSSRFAGKLDLASVGGLLDFRRLRATARWPLMRHTVTHAEEVPEGAGLRPLDPREGDPEGPPLLRRFCSQPLPETLLRMQAGGAFHELPGGPLGNAGAMTCLFGMVLEGRASAHVTASDTRAEYVTHLNLPVEVLVVDLFVHRSLDFDLPPTAALYSRMEQEGELSPSPEDRWALPLPEELESLGSGPPHVASPHYDRHGELVRYTVRRMGSRLEDFRGYRIALRYPPIPTMLSLSHPLLPGAEAEPSP